MPELPEVEAARRAIEEHCVGKKIKRAVVADDPKVIDAVSPSDFQSSLAGKTILGARRKGKNMWLILDFPPFPSFQFGMTGAIYIKGVPVTKYQRSTVKDSDEWPSKYSKVFIELDDGLEFSFTDKRRFAKVRLLQDPETVPPISELGPDALLEPIPLDEFVESLSQKKIAIKGLLLDQNFIAGIGNWIADEVLYQAQVHPLQVASSLSKEQVANLHKCIKEVVQFAVEVDADCSRFPVEWLFHFRWGKKVGKVNGKKIDFITAGGRTSAFVPDLQKLTGMQLGKSASKQRKKSNQNDDDETEDSMKDEPAEKNGTDKKHQAKRKQKGKGNDKDEDQANLTKMARSKQTKVTETSMKKIKTSHNDDSEDGEDNPKKSTKAAKKKQSQPTKRSKKFKASHEDVKDNEGVRTTKAREAKTTVISKKVETGGSNSKRKRKTSD